MATTHSDTSTAADESARGGDRDARRTTIGAAAAMRAVAEDASELVRAEIELARAELKRGIQANLTGAGLLAGAVVMVWLALQGLLIAAGFALALIMPGWAAALTVALALVLIGTLLALVGRRKLTTPVSVEIAKSNLQEDITWARTHLRRR